MRDKENEKGRLVLSHFLFTSHFSRQKSGPGDPAAHRLAHLPLLPSGPGGVHRILLHRAQPLFETSFTVVIWRRGWGSKSRDQIRAPARGPCPLAPSLRYGHPLKRGTFPLRKCSPFRTPCSNPTGITTLYLFIPNTVWRRGWGSNPRYRLRYT